MMLVHLPTFVEMLRLHIPKKYAKVMEIWHAENDTRIYIVSRYRGIGEVLSVRPDTHDCHTVKASSRVNLCASISDKVNCLRAIGSVTDDLDLLDEEAKKSRYIDVFPPVVEGTELYRQALNVARDRGVFDRSCDSENPPKNTLNVINFYLITGRIHTGWN